MAQRDTPEYFMDAWEIDFNQTTWAVPGGSYSEPPLSRQTENPDPSSSEDQRGDTTKGET
jgi:hypothetical protein